MSSSAQPARAFPPHLVYVDHLGKAGLGTEDRELGPDSLRKDLPQQVWAPLANTLTPGGRGFPGPLHRETKAWTLKGDAKPQGFLMHFVMGGEEGSRSLRYSPKLLLLLSWLNISCSMLSGGLEGVWLTFP